MLAFFQMAERVQLNVRVKKDLRERVQADSDRIPKASRDTVVAAILSRFYNSTRLTERIRIYREFMSESKFT